ncbi:MAG: hypothetical protein RJB62_1570, partial [Pseudomonadota bacterium]
NFAPPATEDEIHASALQFVRKLSGMNHPSEANRIAFERAVAEVTQSATLVRSLKISSPPRDREEERLKAKARNEKRFG